MDPVPDDPERDWTAPGVYEVMPGLYRIPLPMPSDGLRAVNVYAVRDGDALVLVDSGWVVPEALDVMQQALRALDADPGRISRILVTHVHRDHYTLAVRLRRDHPSIRVGLGIGERPSLRVVQSSPPDRPGGLRDQLTLCGAAALAKELSEVSVHHDTSEWEDPDDWLEAPSTVDLATASWQAHPTPGHTRGHLVFVDADRDVMFCGDHVLPRITPSIGFEPVPAESPLRDYLDSLNLVRALPDRRLLPAHGHVGPSVHARVDELIEHHDVRLRDTFDALAGTAFETAQRLRWTRRGRAFDELDLLSRCLAVTETAAHLDVLAGTGRLDRTENDGVRYYRVT
ncbi:MBL fold metallo-hydrolase [Virgisporangium aurantiacum]|nr:MBL fold metallo-hydrolase [Virgisporangium aurantiacum]